jgi:hypothetical protein
VQAYTVGNLLVKKNGCGNKAADLPDDGAIKNFAIFHLTRELNTA